RGSTLRTELRRRRHVDPARHTTWREGSPAFEAELRAGRVLVLALGALHQLSRFVVAVQDRGRECLPATASCQLGAHPVEVPRPARSMSRPLGPPGKLLDVGERLKTVEGKLRGGGLDPGVQSDSALSGWRYALTFRRAPQYRRALRVFAVTT